MVTTVTNNTSGISGNEVTSGYKAGIPTLVTNGLIGGGRTNPAGPQLDELGGQFFSPDEHQPLLTREQPPAESDLLDQVSNSNNNNNTKVQMMATEVHRCRSGGPDPELHLAGRISASPATENKILPSGSPQKPPTAEDTQDALGAELMDFERTHNPKGLQHNPKTSVRESPASDPQPPSGNPEMSPPVPALNNASSDKLESTNSEPTGPAEPSAREGPLREVSADHQAAGLFQGGKTKARRPERPCSLDLSSSCISSGITSFHFCFLRKKNFKNTVLQY